MNVPLGTPEKRFADLNRDELIADIRNFMEKKKTGYIVILAEGKYSFQEGFMALDGGMIFASHFEYLKYDKEFKASDALNRTLNLILSGKGLYDIYTWSTQQVELFKVFNDDLMFIENVTPLRLTQIIPKSQKDYETGDLAEFINKSPSREELLKKYKMSEIKEEKPIDEQIADDLEKGIIDEHKQLEEMLSEYISSSEKEKPKMTSETSKLGETPPVGHGIQKFKDLTLKEDK